MTDQLRIHPTDNVAVALRRLEAGEKLRLDGDVVVAKEAIPSGHKIALRTIQPGEKVVKYGYPIGSTTRQVEPGEWVHTHNVKTDLEGTQEYRYHPTGGKRVGRNLADVTFDGYVRKDGSVGIRNEIWIINTVGCINKTAELLARRANQIFQENGIDGILSFPHPYGCSQLGDDLYHTQRILANLVQHPNAAGVLVLGLGCENNHLEVFQRVIDKYDTDRVKFLAIQDVEDEIEEGLAQIRRLVAYAKSFSRRPISISRLTVGLKCGGSDGFSGITANPLVGSFSDQLITLGGTTILTEVPEMFGAETVLMNRAANAGVFDQIVQLINGYKEYFLRHNQPVYENPSPGNKEGGITTLEEKSLGCVQKGGSGEVVDVLPYGGKVAKPGLNLLQGPGNDLISVTALAASGAQLVLFTTGRGTPFGGPVPTVKISTNTPLYHKKKHWLDFDAGRMIGGETMETLAEDLFRYVTKVASGQVRTMNEQRGYREIAIFKDGVIL